MVQNGRIVVTRILHVATVEFTATKLLAPQMGELQRLGFDVQLACCPDGDTFSPALKPFEPERVVFSRSGSPIEMVRGTAQLLRLVAKTRPAVVHLHSPATAFPARVGLALRRYGAKVVYTVHGFAQSWDEMGPKDRVLDAAEKALSHVTDLLLFQSGEDLEAARHRKYRGNLRYLGNGIENDWFEPSAPRPLRDLTAPLKIACTGRLVQEKGVLELLEAAANVENVEISMIGAALASDRDSVADQAVALAERCNGRVKFLGMLPREQVRETLRAQDCFVLPSWREGVPRSMIEAMALGLAIIGTDIRGSRELVRPGVEGWIVPARSATALTGALREAVALDPAKLRGYGVAARHRASAEYRESTVVDRLVAAYAELGVRP